MLSNIFHAANGIAAAVLSPQSLSPEHCIIPPSTEKGGGQKYATTLIPTLFSRPPRQIRLPLFFFLLLLLGCEMERVCLCRKEKGGKKGHYYSNAFLLLLLLLQCVCMGKEEDEREEGKRRLSKCDPLFFLSFPFPALCSVYCCCSISLCLLFVLNRNF